MHNGRMDGEWEGTRLMTSLPRRGQTLYCDLNVGITTFVDNVQGGDCEIIRHKSGPDAQIGKAQGCGRGRTLQLYTVLQ